MDALETERLFMRPLRTDDLESIKRTLQDEKAMYAYEGAFTDREAADWLIRQLLHYEDWGFGLYGVERKKDGKFIGQCGPTYQPWRDGKVLEVGYLFERPYWHHGYATEASWAFMNYAFQKLRASEVSSLIRDMNIPSMNVARRNGMVPVDDDVKYFKGVARRYIRFCKKEKSSDFIT